MNPRILVRGNVVPVQVNCLLRAIFGNNCDHIVSGDQEAVGYVVSTQYVCMNKVHVQTVA